MTIAPVVSSGHCASNHELVVRETVWIAAGHVRDSSQEEETSFNPPGPVFNSASRCDYTRVATALVEMIMRCDLITIGIAGQNVAVYEHLGDC